MSGLLRYAEYLFLDPRLGSSENAKKNNVLLFLIDTAFLGLLLKSIGILQLPFRVFLLMGTIPY